MWKLFWGGGCVASAPPVCLAKRLWPFVQHHDRSLVFGTEEPAGRKALLLRDPDHEAMPPTGISYCYAIFDYRLGNLYPKGH